MAGFRFSVEEAWDAIARAHTGLYTTLRRDGRPITLPVWHAVVDRVIYVRTPTGSQKLKRIRNDPRGYFLVEVGEAWADLAAVTMPVVATTVSDHGIAEEARHALALKYAGLAAPLERLPKAIQARYADETFIGLEPDGRVGSWNNRALLGDDSDPFA